VAISSANGQKAQSAINIYFNDSKCICRNLNVNENTENSANEKRITLALWPATAKPAWLALQPRLQYRWLRLAAIIAGALSHAGSMSSFLLAHNESGWRHLP
jgi:hypothetical protein